MDLAHDDVYVAAPRLVEVGELAVAIAVGVLLSVFEPQELEGDRLLAQLLVDIAPVRGRAGRRRGGRRREQGRLQGGVVEPLGQRPGQPGQLGPPHVIGQGGSRDAQRGADLAEAQTLSQAQAEDVTDLSHGNTGSGQRLLLGWPQGGGDRGRVEPCSPHAGASRPPPRVSENSGMVLRNRSEWVSGIDRNPQTRDFAC